MRTFEVDVNAMVTIYETEHFAVRANSVEEAEEEARKLFKSRMSEKHGYADYEEGEEEIIHYCNDWEEQ